MICPRCKSENAKIVSGNHYICSNENCRNSEGNKTQFKVITDSKLFFPYNVIFKNRKLSEFFRYEYLVVNHK